VLRAMNKNVHQLPAITGEFVGITRLSRSGGEAMLGAFREFTEMHGHGRMDYETGALVAVARTLPITAHIVTDLHWGEIDDQHQYERVVERVWPALGAHQSKVGI
jgi:choline kinase